MAISVAWQTVASFSSSTALYTVPSTGNFGTYARDLVINNSGTVNSFFSLGTGSSSATTTASFLIPPGGHLILTQCQVPASTIIFALGQGNAASSASIGFATNVAFT